MTTIVTCPDDSFREQARSLADRLGLAFVDSRGEGAAAARNAEGESPLELHYEREGLSLTGHNAAGEPLTMRGDFTRLIPRVKPARVASEIAVKAARIKGVNHPSLVDATAGLGEDALLFAAAGFDVTLYELDPVIAALLEDALARARTIAELAPLVARMHLQVRDSIAALATWSESGMRAPDAVYLDPMFPTRSKSAAVKKKFQVIHEIEKPCENESALYEAAQSAHPKKIVVKRPLKGPFLNSAKPSYTVRGKSVRYDCYVLPPR